MHHIVKANTQAFHTGSVDLLPFIPQLGARSNHKSRMDTIGGITREDIRSGVDIMAFSTTGLVNTHVIFVFRHGKHLVY